MSTLNTGADIIASGPAEVESVVVGTKITASLTLEPGIHRHRNYDPAGGDITVTLPPPIDGVPFFLKRISNSANIIRITGETIDRIAGDYILSGNAHRVELMGNVEDDTYDIKNENIPSVGQLARTTSSTTYTPTTSYTKYTDWESAPVETPGRIITDLGNDEIELGNVRLTSGPFKSFQSQIDFTIEYTNNRTVEMQLVHSIDGPVGGPVAINCLGAGKPVSLHIDRPFIVTGEGELSIEFKAETGGGVFTVLHANMFIMDS